MAAVALLHEPLPPPWNYGVVEDGRVFFINEESRETTWLHPAYGHPVQTGHHSYPDLPRGWEREVTEEGAPYYIDHVQKKTTFSHPVTGETAAVQMPHHDPTYQPHNSQHHQQDQLHKTQHRPHYERQKSASKKKSTKVLDRPPSATRREDSPVSMRGWLYKQDSGGLKTWKKRWFVLSDFCLFYYKGPEEGKSQGSVLLPSYRINPCQREDGVNRKFAFKAEHDNMRTYYFCAETQDEMRQWMNAMSLASILQRDPSVELELNQRAPSRDTSRDESFQSTHSSERPLQPPALRWTSEQHYIEDSYYQAGTQGPHLHIQPQDQESFSHEHPAGAYQQYPDEGPSPTNSHQPYRDQYEEPPTNGHQPYRDQYEEPPTNDHQLYRDQYEEEENMFYQPGQLQKQKPLTDLSQFDSNMDIPRFDHQRPYPDETDHAGSGRWSEDVYSQRGLERQNAVRAGSRGDQHPGDPHGRHQQQHPQDYGGSSLGPPGGQPPQQQQQQQGVYNGGRERNSLSGSHRNLPEGYPGRELFPPRPGSASYPTHSPVLDHLQQWKDRVQNSPRPTGKDHGSQGHGHTGQGHGYGSQQDMQQGSWRPEKNLQNNNNPIYENLNAAPIGQGSHLSPGRPPLPATYRDQIVRELAHPHSPTTQHDMISSAERSQHRHETEPLVFQYPEVHPERAEDGGGSWRGSQHQVPESYVKAKHDAEEAARNQRNQQWDQTSPGGQNQNYPDAYWKAKQNEANKNQLDGYSGPDPKRQSSASQRSEPTYSTITEKGLSPRHTGQPADKNRHHQPLYVHTGEAHTHHVRPLTKLTHLELSPESTYRQGHPARSQHEPAGGGRTWNNMQNPSSPSQQNTDFGIKLESRLIDLPVHPSSPRAKAGQPQALLMQKDPQFPGSDSSALKEGRGSSTGYSGLPYSPRQQRKFNNDFPQEQQRQRSRSFGASLAGKFGPPKDSFSFRRSIENDSNASAGNPKHSTPVTSTSEMPSLPYSSLTQQGESTLAVDSPSYPEYNYQDVNIPDYRFSRPEDYMPNPISVNTQLQHAPVHRHGTDVDFMKTARPHSYAPPGYVQQGRHDRPQRPASYVLPTGRADPNLGAVERLQPTLGSHSPDGLVYARLAFVQPEATRQQSQEVPIQPKSKDYGPGYSLNKTQHTKDDYSDNQYQNLPWHQGVDRPMPRAKSISAFTQYSGRPDDDPTLDRKAIDNNTIMTTGSPYNPGSLTRSKSGSHIYDNPEASADLLRAKAKALTASYYTKSPPRPLTVQHQKSQSWSITEGTSPPVSSVPPQPRDESSTGSTPRGRGAKSKAVADLRPAFQNAADAAGLLKIKDHPSQESRDAQRLPARPHSVTLPEKASIDEKDDLVSKRPRSLASPEGTTTRVQRERSRARDRNKDRSRDRSKSRERSRSRDRSLSRTRDRNSGALDSDEDWPPKSRTITIPGKENSPQRPRSIATSSASPSAKAGILRNGTSLPSSPIMQRRPPGTITIPGRSESSKELNKLDGSKTDLDSSSPKKNKFVSSKKVDIPQRPKSISIPTPQDSRQEVVNWTNKRPKSVTIMEFNGERPSLSLAPASPESPNIRKLNLNELDRPYGGSKDPVYTSKSASQSSLRNAGSPEPRFKVLPWLDLPELRDSGMTASTRAEQERIRKMDPARSYLSWTGDSQGLGVSPWAEPEPLGAEDKLPVPQNVANVRTAKSMESLSSAQRQQQATVRPMNWTPAGTEAHVARQQMAPLQQTPPGAPQTHREPDPQNASYNSTYNPMHNNTTYNNTTTVNSFDITTIKEDPTMEDQDVLATKKLDKLKDHLNGHRLRLSISAGDLVGKSHEELVLMLIQLRRSQARLGDAHGWYRRQMDVGRNVEKEYRRRRDSEYEHVPEPLEEEHQHFETLRHGSSQVQKQADISKPLINLVDNLVTMGSLYGGNNLMLASQYKQQRLGPGQYMAPKKMIEFSRQHQEAKLTKEQEEQLKQLQEDEADLEEKLQQLYQLDRELQEHSFAVTSLQEDWELLQKALEGIKNQEAQESDKRALSRLALQRKTIEQELSKVRQQLADASKRLEETAADNARVENEVLLLRKKIMKGLDNGGLDRPLDQQHAEQESESLRTKEQLEAELTSVQMMIDGLSKQGAKLGEVMTTLRRSMPDLTEETGTEETYSSPAEKKSSGPTYAETDLDSMETRDLGNNQRMTIFRDKSSPRSRPTSHVYPQSKTKAVREVISPPDSVSQSASVSYSQPPFTQPLTSPHAAPYSKPPPSGGYLQPQHSHSAQGSYSHPQPPQQQLNGHVRQTSLPTNLPSSPQRNHSSLTDLHKPHTYLQTHRANHRPASATFGHQPTRHGQLQPFVSEPNLAGRDVELSWQDAQTISYSQTVAYSQPPSIAFSEPYGQDRSTSHVYSPTYTSGEAPDYVNIGPLGEVNSETAPEVGEDGYPVMDISEAEDNMKRFYGILPRDKPRAMTVRDIKKRENERRGRERSRRSYTEEDEEEEVVLPNTNTSARTWRSQSMPRISSSSVDGDGETSPALQSTGLLRVKQPDTLLQRSGSTSSNRSNMSTEDKRRSATDRLFPSGADAATPRAQYDPTSVERVRRMSDIFTPKPFSFGGSQPKGYRPVSMFNLSTQPAKAGSDCGYVIPDLPTSPPPPPPPPLPAAVATVRPVFTTAKPPPRGEPSRTVNTATVKPMSQSSGVDNESALSGGVSRRGTKGRRGKDRDRFLTVSSSRPISLESPSLAEFRIRHRSAAGDLITSTVKSESKDGFDFDDLTIEKEVLFVPDKVDIPERYVPDSDDEITEEEAMIRQEKSDKIRKMLAAQSLQEWRENELSENHSHLVEDVTVQQELRAEKRRREALLDIRQALAREVSQKTRQVAESSQARLRARNGNKVERPQRRSDLRLSSAELSPPPEEPSVSRPQYRGYSAYAGVYEELGVYT